MCHLSISRRHDGGEEKGTSFISFLILFPTSHSSVDESEKEGRDMRIQTKEKEIDREGTCPSFIHSFSSHSFISLEFTRIYIYFHLIVVTAYGIRSLFFFIFYYLFLFYFYFYFIIIGFVCLGKFKPLPDGGSMRVWETGKTMADDSLLLLFSFPIPLSVLSFLFPYRSYPYQSLGKV